MKPMKPLKANGFSLIEALIGMSLLAGITHMILNWAAQRAQEVNTMRYAVDLATLRVKVAEELSCVDTLGITVGTTYPLTCQSASAGESTYKLSLRDSNTGEVTEQGTWGNLRIATTCQSKSLSIKVRPLENSGASVKGSQWMNLYGKDLKLCSRYFSESSPCPENGTLVAFSKGQMVCSPPAPSATTSTLETTSVNSGLGGTQIVESTPCWGTAALRHPMGHIEHLMTDLYPTTVSTTADGVTTPVTTWSYCQESAVKASPCPSGKKVILVLTDRFDNMGGSLVKRTFCK